jgi:nitrate/nitrite transporter NarK
MSVVSGYLVSAVGYRWMFVIEGLPAIAWAVAFRRLVADRPSDARWLPEDERSAIERQLESEQQELPEPRGLRDVLRSRIVVVLSAQYFLWSVGVYGLVFWLPSIVEKLTGSGIGTTGLLSAVPYLAATVTMIVVSVISDRLGARRVFTVVPLLVSALCFGLSYASKDASFTTSFILLILAAAGMYAPYGPYFAYIPELFPARDAGPAIGAINAVGGLGGFVGTYIVGALGGADSAVPFAFLAACLFGAAVLVLVVGAQRRAGRAEAPSPGP